ncbi:uncharacterized protein SPAPADRAFT_137163 [Spathaspora passalidarum NRRL Y-27907]|uniref:Solute carrier family 66 member 3 n=1 Tax=Spathaspora passalidarum (strain NRRL Y-27907 / 11-Y1) TaxID=619300 RepID=G3AMM5_SPAPN|nr:uncharacterized protein SPAPADRAFT_137163 [Spathaspora passalidarum NRRL Y-27907]EGW33469.1 hypothetical protein SPAPADRAFT_137163 [Spathaspora passalidarum NRRL Y-27907]
MSSPIIVLIKAVYSDDISNKVLIQMAFSQAKAIGYGRILAAVLGSATVAVSSFIRIPQIRKLLIKSEKSRISVAEGLSLDGLGLETVNYLIHAVFNAQNKVPFINYGESLLLGIQNAIIILLAKFYRLRAYGEIDDFSNLDCKQKVQAVAKSKVANTLAIMVAATVFFTKIAPPQLISALQILNIPFSVIAKLPQIRQNYKLKTASHLSETVLTANVIGSLIRVYTSFTDYSLKSKRRKDTSNEKILVAGYTASLVMNSTLFGQAIVYDKLNKDTEPTEDKDKKKNE